MAIFKKHRVSFGTLRSWNLSMGFFHLLQGVAVLWLSNTFSLPLNTSLPQAERQAMNIVPVLKHVADLQIGPAVAVFFLLSALAHFLLAGPLRSWYEERLKMGINKLRWIEYMISSSVMIWIIAMLSGLYDLPLLITIFALNAIMNLFGLMMELYNQGRKQVSWLPFNLGVVAGAIPWLIIAWYFYSALGSASGAVPGFVYWILVTLFVFFWTFPINMILQYKKVGRWKDYLYGERAYMILSLVAKTLLAWQVFGGTLRG